MGGDTFSLNDYNTSHSEPLPNLLNRLEGVKRAGSGWTARCPAHDDQHNSLSIGIKPDGSALVHCHAGCETKDVLGRVGLSMADLFSVDKQSNNNNGSKSKPKKKGAGGTSRPSNNGATVQQSNDNGTHNSCTLAYYAQAKQLPVDFLADLGLSDMIYTSRPAVRIPHFGVDGSEIGVCYRTAISKSPDGDNRIRWKSGQKKVLYGLDRLQKARDRGYIIMVEGQSDCHTLWYHNEPALGLPGASGWQEDWASYLEGIPIVYVVIEPDMGGQTVSKWLATSSIRDRVRIIKLGTAKDPSGLYLSDPANFLAAWKAALDAAIPWQDVEKAEAQAKAQEVWELCKDLAQAPDILTLFADALARRGVAGERRSAKLLYLGLTSRFFDRPVSIAVKGPSSAGKSHLVKKTSEFFPARAFYALTAMSEKALAYSQEPLSHRILVIYEAAGMSGEWASYLIRSLLSEGRVRYETVDKTRDGLKPKLIEREGPTGLIVTTTAASLHPENETRLLSIPVTDTQEQTRAILRALADESIKPDDSADLAQWHALQEWLETTRCDITIPYGEVLAEIMPPTAIRLRRDFPMMLTMIRTHAFLHQASREPDGQGRIIATLADYEAVRVLCADLMAEGIEATVSETIRETVRAVTDIYNETSASVSQAQLRKRLKLDKGTVSRRVDDCLTHGYLCNLEDRKGKAHRLEPADPLPEDTEILPSLERLTRECCTVGVLREGNTPPPPPQNCYPTNGNGSKPLRCPVQPGTVCQDCTPETRCKYATLYDKYED